MFRNERAIRFVAMVTPEDLKGTTLFDYFGLFLADPNVHSKR